MKLAFVFAASVTVLLAVAPFATAIHVSEVLLTQATLFSGLDKDCTPNATTVCEANIADAVQWCRSIAAAGIPHAFLPTLDRSHILTKLHPKDWGANFALHKKLGAARGFLSSLGFPSDATLATYVAREGDPQLLDSFSFAVAHNFRALTTARLVDDSTALHFVAARRRLDPLDGVAKTAALTMEWSDQFGPAGLYKNTVVLGSDSTPEDFATAMAKYGARPEIICRLYASTDSVELKNGTWLVNVKTTKTHLHRLAIHRLSSTSSTIVNVTLTAQSLELPAANRTDPQYVADRAMMKAEALIAAANNPVQGRTAGPMPASTATDGAALCRRGECAMGNMWADAIRNFSGSDVAFFSGPWVKGPGWAAGNVYLRDIYNSYGFIEPAGQVTVLGLTLHELWRESLAASAFNPYLPTTESGARHLPQVSGTRVKYNLARADVNDRLVSIEVWDRALKEYRPLERLKKYTVSGSQFLMHASAVQGKYLKARYTGEVAFTPINQNVQNLMSQFLTKTAGTYTPGIYGRLIEDNTSVVSMKDWDHRASGGCAADFLLDTEINTCVACPVGLQRAVGETACHPVTTSELATSVLVAIIAGGCLVLLLVGIALFFAVSRWLRFKRTQFCPKDPGAPIAAFFVTVRNEVAVRERFPTTAHAAFKHIEEVVAKAANDHKCFVARRLGAHFLVVGSDPADAVRAVGDVQRAVESFSWETILAASVKDKAAGYKAVRRRMTGSKSQMSSSMTGVRTIVSSHVSSSENEKDSPRSKTSKTSKSSKWSGRSNQGASAPLISAGVAFGTATIEHDEDLDMWSYSGPVVDAAATVADCARPGQLLATEPVSEATRGDETTDAEFYPFTTRRMVCPISRVEKPSTLLQVDCQGCRHCKFEDTSAGESDTAGALTAALEVAAGGLTSRTVGAVCWSIPTLRSPKTFESRADHAKQLEAVLGAFVDVCKTCNADLVSAVDGSFVALVNGAAARTAQVATTTATLARAGVAAVQEVSELRVVAGIATAPAMAGSLKSTVVVSGVAGERARLLATVGFAATDGHHPVAEVGAVTVVVAGELVSDLEPYYILAAVDAIDWPEHCVARHTADTSLSLEPVCVHALIDEKCVAEDEWLYQLAEATSSNPYAKGNAVLQHAVSGSLPEFVAAAFHHPAPSEGSTPTYPTVHLEHLIESLTSPESHQNPTFVVDLLHDRLRRSCMTFARVPSAKAWAPTTN